MKKEKFGKAEAEYDFENDIFSAIPQKREYDSSFQTGNLIFDLNKEGKINGIEILDASGLFGMPKAFLGRIISGRIEIIADEKVIRLKIILKSLVRNAHKTGTINVERLRPDLVAPAELKLALAC